MKNENLPNIIQWKYGLRGMFDFECKIKEDAVYISEWKVNIPKPTTEEVMAFEQAWLDWKAATAYKGLRGKAYPTIQDQLDMMYWDKVNGTTKWEEAIAKVKTDYPKP